ncbi:PhnB protein [Lysinibacillus composti]|uniref:VOC family protein n=1 Tax=Lysinibacillus composti TaxID=720633 RepID=A0A3N9UJH0_9BACI|nr:VOC family protein [Lysinibacillus composti]MBM7607331.1 PhnB protein [Lysinibacillus composti]RQW76101.1 VOC family protein [Lysinibacillus composti]
MKSANPYIFVDQCVEVMTYYKGLFNCKVKNLQLDDSGKCFYGELHIGESIIHFSDTFGKTDAGNQVRISLVCESEDELKRVYESLSEDATITVPLQQTFWGGFHANLIDRFGIGWLLNYTQNSY